MKYVSLLVLLSLTSLLSADEKLPCHESPKYLIVEGTTGEVGTNFLVKYKRSASEKPSCQYMIEKGDFEIKNEWAEYFMALQGDLLVLDSGTGPYPRGLIIWDLRQQKKVYSGSYSEPYEIHPGYIEFWMETGMATDENCPEQKEWSPLGSAIETKVQLKLNDFSVIMSTETQCSARQ